MNRQRAGPGSRRSCHARRGNAIAEFALIIFPFFALIFGIMSICYMIFLQGIFANAVRAGCRWAITFNYGTYDGFNCASQQDSCIKAVVQDNSFGFLSGSNSQYIVVNYYPPFRLSQAIASSEVTGGHSITSTDSSYSNVTYMNQTNNVVSVTVSNYPAAWLAPFPGYLNQQTFNLNATASDVLQGYGVAANGSINTAPPTAGPPY